MRQSAMERVRGRPFFAKDNLRPVGMRSQGMSTIAAHHVGHPESPPIPWTCRELIGDWTDVSDKRGAGPMQLHVALKAIGNQVFGAIHVTRSNRWLRMKLTPGWLCALGTVFERRDGSFVHVATVRLCHSWKRRRSVLWQLRGQDQSGCLPRETILWEHR
jgi:hypothetical protein